MKASRLAWQLESGEPSLREIFRTVPVSGGKLRRALAFFGPGYLIAVGYMDPGNWATDIYGGSAFGYTLLAVIMLSNLMAMVLQHLAIRLGVATGRDLAQACRDHYSKPVSVALWVLCEVAIIACDLAELIGTAIALQLLFGLPLLYGVILTAVDVFALLLLARWGFRLLEALVLTLLTSVFIAFAIQLSIAAPDLGSVSAGFIPRAEIFTNPLMLYVGIGILGATVMPHNLYLHSSIVQSRAYAQTLHGKREATLFATIDSTFALFIALFVNAAILIVAATAFHDAGRTVVEIQEAYRLLPAALGTSLAATLFALALLASGQNSTITATMAGQIVMEGFLSIRLSPFLRRVMTRGVALVPAIFVTAAYGERATGQLLVLSQVILSIQLPFAIVPLVMFTSDKTKMGEMTIGPGLRAISIAICAAIILANVKLLADLFL